MTFDQSTLMPETQAFVARRAGGEGLLITGTWRRASDGRTLDSNEPASGAVIGPIAGADVSELGRSAGTRIVEDGSALVASGLASASCANLECEIGRAAAIGALSQITTPSSIDPMHDAPSVGPAPVPPPRPDWAV